MISVLTQNYMNTQVIFQHSSIDLYRHPDDFFANADSRTRIKDVNVLFKVYDIISRKVVNHSVPGSEIVRWAPIDFPIDLKTKFRREKFGNLLVKYLRLTYTALGDFYIYLEDVTETSQKT